MNFLCSFRENNFKMTKCIRSWFFFFHCIFFYLKQYHYETIPSVGVLYLLWVYYTFHGCTISSVGVLYLPWVYYTFCGCTIPSVGVLYLLWMYYTFHGCTIPSVGVLYLLWMYYTFHGCTITSVGVLYLLWVFYTFHGWTIPSVGVLYLPWVYNTLQNVDFQRIICFFIWNMEGVANSVWCWENAYFTIKKGPNRLQITFFWLPVAPFSTFPWIIEIMHTVPLKPPRSSYSQLNCF